VIRAVLGKPSTCRGFVLAALFASTAVAAPEASAPLAQIDDAHQLGEELTAIASDPAIPVTDPADRPFARRLLAKGVEQLQARAYDQGLANLLAAYDKVPNPKLLLDIASTLRDLGRPADAANTYRRYLADPHTVERVSEITELLRKLDEQLTTLVIVVEPKGTEISIDAGTFIPVGGELVTRVRPGIHLLRARTAHGSREVSINGFEGERKDVSVGVPDGAPDRAATLPDHQDGWLLSGLYTSDAAHPNRRGVLTRTGGDVIAAIVPPPEVVEPPPIETPSTGSAITSGLVGALRIDAGGRGFAGAFGLAIGRGRIEGQALILRSNQTGGFVGARYRFLDDMFRPYGAVGFPGFVFDTTTQDATGIEISETKLAIGVRIAAGLELAINRHLGVQAELGFEHFWFIDDTAFLANLWVPSVGVIGRL